MTLREGGGGGGVRQSTFYGGPCSQVTVHTILIPGDG